MLIGVLETDRAFWTKACGVRHCTSDDFSATLRSQMANGELQKQIVDVNNAMVHGFLCWQVCGHQWVFSL